MKDEGAEASEPVATFSEVPKRELSARIPLATYRLQFNGAFTFADATRLVSYLHTLGISDCYASPYFKASAGSPHGYDVIDHNTLNPEVGSEEEYETFVKELQRYHMGHMLDVVPNHVGIVGSKNPRWTDVLENGPSSLQAPFFDIDWKPVKAELANKVLLPILGDQYGRVLENQELTLCYEDGAFSLWYYDHRLPIAPRPSTSVLSHRLGDLERSLGSAHPHFLEFRSILTALTHLPLRTETDRERVIERNREKEIIKKRLAALTTACGEVQTFVTENLRFFNGIKGDPRSFDLLDALLDDQAYRLAYWRVAADEINYRRFFDINELAAIRTEEPAVFAETHRLVLRLLAERKVTGLRIDHVDGLYDPAAYLSRLQDAARFALHCRTPAEEISTSALIDRCAGQRPVKALPPFSDLPCYVVAEKIIGQGEQLPEQWPIHGTTGYDFLAVLNGIFVDQDNEKRLTDIYTRFTRTRADFPALVYETKKLIMQVSLSSEMNVLAHQLNRLSERNRHSRDFTLNSLAFALREIIACFPVYRTYIRETEVTDRDQTVIETAVARAKDKNPAIEVSVFNYVRDILLLRFPDSATEEDRQAQQAFVMKFQQYTGPVMAKGLEDTTFYIYNRLVSLNEVGGTPEQFGISLTTFHEHNRERLERWPHALLTTTSHDTKRSEDVRARIDVLSEIPHEWQTALKRWSKLNKKKRPLVDGRPVPDRNEEYLLYQTLLGVWPLMPMTAEEYHVFKQRVQDYMRKATKEAKVNTSWLNPNHAYDDALQDFVGAVLDGALLLDDFQTFRQKVAQYGMYNALSQTLLKLTVPGVPDIYQGNEVWDFSLVDPDNRRPVNYEHRRQLLSVLQEQLRVAGQDRVGLVRDLLNTREDGRIKLYVIAQTLSYRRAHAALFRGGDYHPLEGRGAKQRHCCAFIRQHKRHTCIVVVPRFLTRLISDPHLLPLGAEIWGDTWLTLPSSPASQRYHNLFTGGSLVPVYREGAPMLALGEVFAKFPVACLTSIEPQS